MVEGSVSVTSVIGGLDDTLLDSWSLVKKLGVSGLMAVGTSANSQKNKKLQARVPFSIVRLRFFGNRAWRYVQDLDVAGSDQANIAGDVPGPLQSVQHPFTLALQAFL